jgi:microcystin-dependent protein
MGGNVPVGKDTAGTFVTLGATGGEETHQLVVTEMPSHAHSESAVSAGTPSGTISANSAGTPAGTIASAGAHTHTVSAIESGGGVINDNGLPVVTGAVVAVVFTTSSAGAHSHTFTGTALGTHSHTFTGSAMPTHSHVIGSTGGGQTHNNIQPYVVVNYIIKT